MANIETMSVKFAQYSKSKPPSEVPVQISSSKLKALLKASLFAPVVSGGGSQFVGQADRPLRKLHETEKKQNVSRTLEGANSSPVRKNYSQYRARLHHGQDWGKVDWAPWRQPGNDIFINLCPFRPRPTPVVPEGIVSETMGELTRHRAGSYHNELCTCVTGGQVVSLSSRFLDICLPSS